MSFVVTIRKNSQKSKLYIKGYSNNFNEESDPQLIITEHKAILRQTLTWC